MSPQHPVDPPVRAPRTALLHLPATARPARIGAARDAYGNRVEEAVDAAAAVLAVTVALVRYAAEQGARPLVPRLPSLRRGLASPFGRLLAHPVSAAVRMISTAADVVVPELAQAVLARLDVVALVRDYVDLDRLVTLLDVDAVVARVDLDRAVDRVDLQAIAARLDLDTLVEKVDITRVIDRVDLDAIVDRVDVVRVLEKVDLDDVVARVDLDRAVERVDIDRVLARTDVAGLARYVVDIVDLPGLLRASTGVVTSDMVRGVRDQGVDADRAVERVVDRLLHRHGRRTLPDSGTPEVPA
jgi:hypothetical protein